MLSSVAQIVTAAHRVL